MTESTANILLVDDDWKSLMAMEALLDGPGRRLVKAQSGPDALRWLLRQDFALILLDVRMPEMDGFETAMLIRQRERSRYTPIIFLSAIDTLESDVLKGVSSGAVDYLFKPVVPEVLKAKVQVFVDLYHMNERLKRQALRQSEERFRLLVESLQDYSIVMLNPEGKVTSWNIGAERITGYRQEEILGQPLARFHTVEDQEEGRPNSILRAAATQGHYEEEGWRVRKDGSLYWAMNGVGRLSLRTEVAEGQSLQNRFPDARAPSYITIAVTDTGVGIDRAIRERIFDPFFTTKGKGQGTGLGLTVVYGVVRSHDGFIEVASEPNHGATFRIFLPARPDHGASTTLVADPIQQEAAEGPEGATILFVDDEENQALLVHSFLQQNGYRVLIARDGMEALEMYNQHSREIAAVILDLGLPKLGGWEVFLRMQGINAELKAIFTTGYIDRELKSQMLKAGVINILQKPYLPLRLMTHLRQLLNGTKTVAQAESSAPANPPAHEQ